MANDQTKNVQANLWVSGWVAEEGQRLSQRYQASGVGGAGGYTVTTETTTPYAASAGDYILFNLSGTNAVVNLPVAATAGANAQVGVKKIDDGTELVTVSGNGGETIDGSTTLDLLSQYEAVELICDGSNWWVMG